MPHRLIGKPERFTRLSDEDRIVLGGRQLTVSDLDALQRVALFNPDDLYLEREGAHLGANARASADPACDARRRGPAGAAGAWPLPRRSTESCATRASGGKSSAL